MPANLMRNLVIGVVLVAILGFGPILLRALFDGGEKSDKPAAEGSAGTDQVAVVNAEALASVELHAGAMHPDHEADRAALFFSVKNKSSEATKVIVQLDAGEQATLSWAGPSSVAEDSQSSCWQAGEFVRCGFDSLEPGQLQAVDVYLKTSEPTLRVKLLVLDTEISAAVDLVSSVGK